MWKKWAQPGKTSKFPKIKLRKDPSVQDPHIKDLRQELSKLYPTLQRNVGIISDVRGLAKLAQVIEFGDTIAVSDASIGSRSRASHSYIVTTKNRKHYIQGATPIDCDVKDARAKLFGQVAIHTNFQ